MYRYASTPPPVQTTRSRPTLAPHFPLPSQCSICAETMSRHERVIARMTRPFPDLPLFSADTVFAVYGSPDSTCYRGHSRPFVFPRDRNPAVVDGFSLCRMPDCNTCAMGAESVLVHFECFQISGGSAQTEASMAYADSGHLLRGENPGEQRRPFNSRLPSP